MTKHLDAFLHGVRQSLQLAPQRSYIDPRAQSPAKDTVRIRGDALSVVRTVDKAMQVHGVEIKNR